MADYNNFYQTENLFGSPYPELIEFFTTYPRRGKLLDLGCGQGRDAIVLARLGYKVTGLDNSKVGLSQMTAVAEKENLDITGIVGDIYHFEDINHYDFLLMDSMFHFTKKDKTKEIDFINNLLNKAKPKALIIFCVQNSGSKASTLRHTINLIGNLRNVTEKKFDYIFEDTDSGHQSKTNYIMVVIEKLA